MYFEISTNKNPSKIIRYTVAPKTHQEVEISTVRSVQYLLQDTW